MIYLQTFTRYFDFSVPPQLAPIQEKGSQALKSLLTRLHFLQRFIESPTTVGSVIPSSRFLAKKIVWYISEDSHSAGKHYLEVGPGTGPFTSEIVRKLSDTDVLDVVEIDPTFCKILKEKFSSKPNVHIHCLSIADWKPAYQYDAIVSGLPLNAFAPAMVRMFIDTFKKLAKSGGTVSYFEYIGLPTIKVQTLSADEKAQFKEVLDIKNQFFKDYGIDSETVYLNLPPARVLHFRVGR